MKQLCGESAVAAAAFAALCIAVLSVAPQPAEPDDGAYHASIVALADGHFLMLSLAQALHVARQVHDNPSAPPNQWVDRGHGRYISEKDPGYPYLAVPFQEAGVIRWAPLFYGALACVGIFVGARRWLGRFGGPAAVGLYCSSGAALAFAWRDYMPTFTDASLAAAGLGALLWTVLATEAALRLRTAAGLAAFAALELATFARYTNVVILGCAVVAVLAAWRSRAAGLQPLMVWSWLASVVVFGIGLAVFDDVAYGGPLRSGYPAGEINFAVAAVGPNLRILPAHLLRAMPMLLLAAAALVWIVVRRLRRVDGAARRDLAVALALAASALAVSALYSAYTWTADDPTEVTVQVVRFYVPVLGPVALLGAWLVTRVPGRLWRPAIVSVAVVAALFGLAVWQFHAMYAEFGVPLGSAWG